MNKKEKKIDLWFSVGSTYTYLTVTRIKDTVKKNNININLKPFNVRTIMLEMDNRPFPPSKKIKVDHMWRDIQRRAEIYKIVVPSLPVPYPLKNMELANQIALLGVNEGWCLEYLELTYHNWFINKLPAGEDENLILTFKKLNIPIFGYIENSINELESILENNLFGDIPKLTSIKFNKKIYTMDFSNSLISSLKLENVYENIINA